MADEARGYLIRQFDTAWKLTNFHLDGLATEECLWRPAHAGLHVHQVPDGRWRADWPDHEGYDVELPDQVATGFVGHSQSLVRDRKMNPRRSRIVVALRFFNIRRGFSARTARPEACD